MDIGLYYRAFKSKILFGPFADAPVLRATTAGNFATLVASRGIRAVMTCPHP